MRMRCLVLTLLLFCLLGSAILGCSGGQGTDATQSGTTTVDSALTTTTAQRTTTTLAPATWETLTPIGDPPVARLGGSLVYISTGGKLLLFGGWAGGTTYIDSTWSYDLATSTWTDLQPAGARPAARASHSAAYDPTRNRVIVFGGYNGTSYYNDTWAYDPATNKWANLRPSRLAPAARVGHSLVYDPGSKKMILFGGYDGSTQYNDTWAYDPATNKWANLRPAGQAPAARDSQAMVYDPKGKVMILFGGWSTTMQFGDTWAYSPSGNTWTALKPAGEVPAARALHQMVYDPAVKKMVLFGGGTSSTEFNDTWDYDPSGNSWVKVGLTGTPPAARAGHALVYDSAKRELVLFGGFDGVTTYYNDLWVMRRGNAVSRTTVSSTSLAGTSSTSLVTGTTEP